MLAKYNKGWVLIKSPHPNCGFYCLTKFKNQLLNPPNTIRDTYRSSLLWAFCRFSLSCCLLVCWRVPANLLATSVFIVSRETSALDDPATLASPVAELPFLVRFSLFETALGISTVDYPYGINSTISVTLASVRNYPLLSRLFEDVVASGVCKTSCIVVSALFFAFWPLVTLTETLYAASGV